MVHNKLKINLKCRRCNDFLVGGCITKNCMLALCVYVWVYLWNWEYGGLNASNTIIFAPFFCLPPTLFITHTLTLLTFCSLAIVSIEYVNTIMDFYSLSCAIDFYVLLILFRSFCLPRHYLIACILFVVSFFCSHSYISLVLFPSSNFSANPNAYICLMCVCLWPFWPFHICHAVEIEKEKGRERRVWAYSLYTYAFATQYTYMSGSLALAE